jgi:hypothetical protein
VNKHIEAIMRLEIPGLATVPAPAHRRPTFELPRISFACQSGDHDRCCAQAWGCRCTCWHGSELRTA